MTLRLARFLALLLLFVGTAHALDVDVRTYGARCDGTTADQAAINKAITAAAAASTPATRGNVKFPKATCAVTGSITLLSNVSLVGVPGHSWLKVNAASSFDILTSTTGTLENVTIDGLAFDGSLNYPASSLIYQFGGSLPLNSAISITRTLDVAQATSDVTNLVIKNVRLFKLSEDGIQVNGHNNTYITIRDSHFNYGSYRGQVIRVRPPTGAATSQNSAHVLITGNTLDINGPQQFYDASKEDYISSTDAIAVDRIRDSEISFNRIHKAGCIAIRVEASIAVSTIGNAITESGCGGITYYNAAHDGTIVGNTIKAWGRTPPAFAMRNYTGTYVVAREFPRNPGAVLPADPTASSWFETWPYITSGVDTGTIVAYNSADYYTTGPSGILPFRGDAAIAVTQESARCVVTGNVAIADTTQTGGKYNYASDYGFTPVHPVNNMASTTGTADGCFIGPNQFTGRVSPVYWPQNADRINAAGALGSGTFSARGVADATYIRSNKPAFSLLANGTQSNIATGSNVTVQWQTEVFDQGNNVASNTFTAPATGRYQLSAVVILLNLDTAATAYEVTINTSNRAYRYQLDPSKFSGDVTTYTATLSVLADMGTGDTATVYVNQGGGAAQTDIGTDSFFMGVLVD